MQLVVRTRRQRARKTGHAIVLDRLGKRLEDGRFRIEQPERMFQDRVLKLRIARFAERSSQREVTVQTPRRRNAFDLLLNRPQRDGCKAFGFEDVGKRTHGTRTERSDRCQQNDVNAAFTEQFGAGRPAVEAHA